MVPMGEHELSVKALGQLNEVARLADQRIDDWSRFMATDQFGLEAYRYQIAFMAYTVALAQYHFLPAYRERLKDVFQKLITRLLARPVWEYWAEVSRGHRQYDPDWPGPAQPQHDPISDRNIMYSGHVGHMIALYEMLYRDFSWEQDGAIRMDWDENEEFRFSLRDVIESMYRQMKYGPTGGIECEPNAVFPECNQHPVLAFMLYDHLHGSSYSHAGARFRNLFYDAPMIDPKNHEVIFYYRAKQRTVVSRRHPAFDAVDHAHEKMQLCCGVSSYDSSAACGWTGVFMNAWDPELVSSHYPHQKRSHFDEGGSGVVPRGGKLFGDMGVGLFAALAAEMGDSEFQDGLLDYADHSYRPEWRGSSYIYPGTLDDENGVVTHLGVRLLGFARVNGKNGIRDLHTHPWGDARFQHPLFERIEPETVQVAAAHWDGNEAKLEAVFVPEVGADCRLQLEVSGVDAGSPASVIVDGKTYADVAPGSPSSADRAGFKTPGRLRVRVPISGVTKMEVRARPSERQAVRS